MNRSIVSTRVSILESEGTKANGAEVSGPSFSRRKGERWEIDERRAAIWAIETWDERKGTVSNVDPGGKQSGPHSRQCQSPPPTAPFLP